MMSKWSKNEASVVKSVEAKISDVKWNLKRI